MSFRKIVKCIALFLLSAISLTAIFYLAVLISAVLGEFNEHIVCCLVGVLHSAIAFLLGYKFINKIGISKSEYLVFVSLIPALLFNASCVLYQCLNNTVSILDSESEIGYYLIFMSIASLVSFIATAVTELIILLANRKKPA